MPSTFPRPQQPNNVANVNNAMGAMRGDSMSMLRLLANRNPAAANALSMLQGMSPQQIEQRARQMMQDDPRFAELARNVQSKGFMQAARDYGLNL